MLYTVAPAASLTTRSVEPAVVAVALQLLVDSLVAEPGHGAVLLVARPEADPLPRLRRLATAVGIRLPGDR